MKDTKTIPINYELTKLCNLVRNMVVSGHYEACLEHICNAMEKYPHAPEPHNLLGIVLEKTGDHGSAMKHFRAALALDSTYLPANHNLVTYGTFRPRGKCAFDEGDVPPPAATTQRDSQTPGANGYKTKIAYSKYSMIRVAGR